ncbi:hypothetical protein BC831DRAFT_442701 [Entophlyctis helioformis]|nr:hypothetical protein BC831DRAFT_442701 [Entophlyctis helioformis]
MCDSLDYDLVELGIDWAASPCASPCASPSTSPCASTAAPLPSLADSFELVDASTGACKGTRADADADAARPLSPPPFACPSPHTDTHALPPPAFAEQPQQPQQPQQLQQPQQPLSDTERLALARVVQQASSRAATTASLALAHTVRHKPALLVTATATTTATASSCKPTHVAAPSASHQAFAPTSHWAATRLEWAAARIHEALLSLARCVRQIALHQDVVRVALVFSMLVLYIWANALTTPSSSPAALATKHSLVASPTLNASMSQPAATLGCANLESDRLPSASSEQQRSSVSQLDLHDHNQSDKSQDTERIVHDTLTLSPDPDSDGNYVMHIEAPAVAVGRGTGSGGGDNDDSMPIASQVPDAIAMHPSACGDARILMNGMACQASCDGRQSCFDHDRGMANGLRHVPTPNEDSDAPTAAVSPLPADADDQSLGTASHAYEFLDSLQSQPRDSQSDDAHADDQDQDDSSHDDLLPLGDAVACLAGDLASLLRRSASPFLTDKLDQQLAALQTSASTRDCHASAAAPDAGESGKAGNTKTSRTEGDGTASWFTFVVVRERVESLLPGWAKTRAVTSIVRGVPRLAIKTAAKVKQRLRVVAGRLRDQAKQIPQRLHKIGGMMASFRRRIVAAASAATAAYRSAADTE